jgi:ABC-type spermidine/putrescine transport system permease subunit I
MSLLAAPAARSAGGDPARARRRVSATGLLRLALLSLPIVFMIAFVLGPLAITFAMSFWQRVGFTIQPAFSLAAYQEFFSGVRMVVLRRSFVVAVSATAIALVIAYPIAYFLAFRASRAVSRVILLLLTIPFLVNYIIRNFAWAYLLGRTGPLNALLLELRLVDKPVDWLLFSDFSVFVGLIASYMPFMVFPLTLSLAGIDRRQIEASWLLGATPWATFWRITLPLSLPGLFAAVVFGFVGVFGESAVSLILGGAGYELMGNTISSAMDVLNYPLAAAMSSVVVGVMALLLMAWYAGFDLRSFLGHILRWRY